MIDYEAVKMFEIVLDFIIIAGVSVASLVALAFYAMGVSSK